MDKHQEERLWQLIAKRYNGEASAPELAELETLLAASPVTDSSLETIQAIWDTPLTEAHSSDNAKAWETLQQRIPPSTSRISKPVWWAAAAAVIVISSLFLFDFSGTEQRSSAAIRDTAVHRGMIQASNQLKKKVVLSDHTTIWLKPNSQIEYDPEAFGRKNRTVRLVGEAFFDVTRNEKLPFIVHAGDLAIAVKGTAFNVKAYPGKPTIETLLVHGKVEVYQRQAPTERVMLAPNEKIVVPVDSSGSAVYTQAQLSNVADKTDNETAWVTQKLDFDNEPFGTLAAKLENWYGIKVIFKDETIKKRRFSAVIIDETLQETLDAMQLSSPFHYEWNGDTLLIGTARKQE